MDAIDPALSALDAVALSLQVTANNVANLDTPDFASSRVVFGDLPEYSGVSVLGVYEGAPGVDLAREMVDLVVWERTYEANAAVIRAQEEMAGAVLDISA